MTVKRIDRISAPNSHRQHARLTHKGNIGRRRHGWLRLTPAYSLHLVEELIGEASADELLLDPFSGTGTTPLAGAVAGVRSHAVDINPFLVWLGSLKCTRFSKEDSEDLREAVKQLIGKFLDPTDHDPWTPDLHQIEKWWEPEILRALSALFASLSAHQSSLRPVVSDLLKVVFCRTAITTSNAAFNHQSMSFKKKSPSSAQGSLFVETTGASGRRVADEFAKAADLVCAGISEDNPKAEARVFLGDSRDLAKALPTVGYTRVITSPPYPNRMSYIRELRPYMYWLGYLTNGREAGELDWQAIGGTWGCATSNLASWVPSPEVAIPYPNFDALVAAISAEHPLLGRYVHKYFEDMLAHVASLKSVLAEDAQCHYVVGNSKFYDTILPVEEIFAALFEDAKFHQVKIERIRKRNSKKELYEFVVHARKGAA